MSFFGIHCSAKNYKIALALTSIFCGTLYQAGKQMTGGQAMDHFNEIDLQDCPCCGNVGTIEEEGGWCVYVQCGYVRRTHGGSYS